MDNYKYFDKYRKTSKGRKTIKRYQSSLKGRYAMLKVVAKKRNIPMSITQQYYKGLLSKPCSYCKEALTISYGSGLDRLDNTRGYEVGNVVACCQECNRIKSNKYTPEQMMELARFMRYWTPKVLGASKSEV